MLRWRYVAVFIWIGLLLGAAAWADDIQVNTYTTGDQVRASVAVNADGDSVVVWQSEGSGGTDSSERSIQGRRYAADGSPVGGEFQVNTYTTNGQFWPSVAMDADGNFVVVWTSSGSGGTDTSSSSIQGQRYASDGSPVGEQFQVNTYTTLSQLSPSVAMSLDGDFVVVWQSPIFTPNDPNVQIQGQRYASDGSPVGGEFQVNTYNENGQILPSVAMDADGDFVVVWQSYGSNGTDSSETSIQGQLYASDGSPVGGEFQVNTYTTDTQYRASLAMDADGNFVVIWTNESSAFFSGVQGQRYASDGSPVGGEFEVHDEFSDNVYYSRAVVDADADGDFVVVWHSHTSNDTDTSNLSIQGRRFASDGSPLGGRFQINTYTTGRQFWPSVAMKPDGDYVVVWESPGSGGTDSSEFSIQRTPVVLIFADGFESGDTTAWSQQSVEHAVLDRAGVWNEDTHLKR